MNKLICMGEYIVDFLPSSPGSLTYTAKAGGAPANVCASVAKFGAPAYYLAKMADDNFAKYIKNEMQQYGVNTSMVVIDDTCKTSLAIVDQYENGDRDFFFYRDKPADANLSPDSISEDMFESGDILHFCSVALVESPTKHAHEKAISFARRNGALVSFDINARLNLWRDKTKLVDTICEFLPFADIIKATDDELYMIAGDMSEKDAVAKLLSIAVNAKLVFITKGEKGACVYDRNLNFISYPAKSYQVVDTTGAGDCFSGSIIYKLLTKQASLSIDGIANAVEFAINACACVIAQKGAMNAMPTLEQVEDFKNGKLN